MNRKTGRFLFLTGVTLMLTLGACHTIPDSTPAMMLGEATAPSQVTPDEALQIADAYCKIPWLPFARNILHGNDANGVLVDTPDVGYKPPNGLKGFWVPGVVNIGMPYKWGGFDDLTSFHQGVDAGLAAGDVSSPRKRALDNAGVSQYAVGVDCSGLVSRCLKLPRAYDSSQLPAICDPLSDARDLLPGDLLNIPREHVMLVAGWTDAAKTEIVYYETGGIPEWKAALKVSPLHKLLALGFQPLRYKGMARLSKPSGKEVLTRSAVARAIYVAEPQVGAR